MTAVVGLDLSLTGTGICTDHGCYLVKPTKSLDGLARMRWIRGQVRDRALLDPWPGPWPQDVLVVVEGLAFASHTGKASERAGLWWMIQDDLADRARIAVVTPSGRAKFATGKGNAPKDTVMLEAARRLPNLGITDNNTADAAVLYAMGRDHLGQPVTPFPATHRAALDAVTWPR